MHTRRVYIDITSTPQRTALETSSPNSLEVVQGASAVETASEKAAAGLLTTYSTHAIMSQGGSAPRGTGRGKGRGRGGSRGREHGGFRREGGVAAGERGQYYCELCNVYLKNGQALGGHYSKSQQHRVMLMAKADAEGIVGGRGIVKSAAPVKKKSGSVGSNTYEKTHEVSKKLGAVGSNAYERTYEVSNRRESSSYGAGGGMSGQGGSWVGGHGGSRNNGSGGGKKARPTIAFQKEGKALAAAAAIAVASGMFVCFLVRNIHTSMLQCTYINACADVFM